jgi:hypothetical protein
MTPIVARLAFDHTCIAEGFVVKSHDPVGAVCRKLLAEGYDPATPLHLFRHGFLGLRIESIGEGARPARRRA